MNLSTWPKLGARKRAALARQDTFHRNRVEQGATVLDKLRAACSWLVAEAKRGGPQALSEDLETVLELAEQRRRSNLPATTEEAA